MKIINSYVVGFLREDDMILLIEKQRPDWQAGKLNGIGGKIETLETPFVAMVREFEEETGLRIQEWSESVIMQGPDWIVYVFYAYGLICQAKTTTDESIVIVNKNMLPSKVLPNLHWLIPLSFDQQVTKPIEIRCFNSKDLAIA